jgi:hypothetical protein
MAERELDQPTKELSPVPLAPLFDNLEAENVEFAQQKGLELRIRPTRAVVVSNIFIFLAPFGC